ncbi:MAG: DUF1501 domain-containing protein [Acidobacteria bacterium]|nr:DUF1501 domain-containing protein [Acidobacteriota bacterium]
MKSGISRREAVRGGLLGAAGLLLAGDHLGSPLCAAAESAKGKARSVIQIWMWGGPSHLDTFDPKPQAGNDYTGPLNNPITTNVKGIMIGELLPLLAKQTDKYSIIRSMTHGINAHETASYMVQTARPPGGRDVYPSVGAVVSLFKGYNAGYKGLIQKLNTLEHAMQGDAQLAASEEAGKQAYDLILGDAGKVFDLSQEKDELKESYGRNTFGQACLVARRLVERGVPYITINSRGWDTHKQHFQIMRQRLPQMDRGMAALLQDLSDRGLLDTTIVWWTGEFGRTPRVQWEPPWSGGRGHYGRVFSAVVAGGGFKGGRVVGASDAKGEEVKERPVYPVDLIASMYELLGIDQDGKLPHPLGVEARVTPTAAEGVTMSGRLKEIM